MNIDIKHIAKLARLRIEDDQLDKFESEMQNIVGMVEKLPDEMTLDPDNPMILRKDVAVQDKFTRQELMQNAPQVKAGCLVVPKTVE